MNNLQAAHLHDLAAGVYAVVIDAQQTDDPDHRSGLLAAAEHLAFELKSVIWSHCEAATEATAKRIDPELVRAFGTDPTDQTSNAIYNAMAAAGHPITHDAELSMVDDGSGALMILDQDFDPLWHIAADGRVTKQGCKQ